MSSVIFTWTGWFAALELWCRPSKGTRVWWNTSGHRQTWASQSRPFLLYWAREPVLVAPEGCQAHPLGCVSCGHMPTQRYRFPPASFRPKFRRALQSLGREGPHGSHCRLCRRAWVQVSFAVHQAPHCSDSWQCCPPSRAALLGGNCPVSSGPMTVAQKGHSGGSVRRKTAFGPQGAEGMTSDRSTT